MAQKGPGPNWTLDPGPKRTLDPSYGGRGPKQYYYYYYYYYLQVFIMILSGFLMHY